MVAARAASAAAADSPGELVAVVVCVVVHLLDHEVGDGPHHDHQCHQQQGEQPVVPGGRLSLGRFGAVDGARVAGRWTAGDGVELGGGGVRRRRCPVGGGGRGGGGRGSGLRSTHGDGAQGGGLGGLVGLALRPSPGRGGQLGPGGGGGRSFPQGVTGDRVHRRLPDDRTPWVGWRGWEGGLRQAHRVAGRLVGWLRRVERGRRLGGRGILRLAPATRLLGRRGDGGIRRRPAPGRTVGLRFGGDPAGGVPHPGRGRRGEPAGAGVCGAPPAMGGGGGGGAGPPGGGAAGGAVARRPVLRAGGRCREGVAVVAPGPREPRRSDPVTRPRRRRRLPWRHRRRLPRRWPQPGTTAGRRRVEAVGWFRWPGRCVRRGAPCPLEPLATGAGGGALVAGQPVREGLVEVGRLARGHGLGREQEPDGLSARGQLHDRGVPPVGEHDLLPARGRVQPGPHQEPLDLGLGTLDGDAGRGEQQAESLGGLGPPLDIASQSDAAELHTLGREFRNSDGHGLLLMNAEGSPRLDASVLPSCRRRPPVARISGPIAGGPGAADR